MKQYIVYLPNEHPFVIEEENAVFYGKPIAELIRCMDCKHYEHLYADRGRCFLWADSGASVWCDGYCNYAEVKNND